MLQLKQICTTINICLIYLYDAVPILGSNLRMHDNQPHARKLTTPTVKGNSAEKATQSLQKQMLTPHSDLQLCVR